MTLIEINALEVLIEHILGNEYISYCEHIDEGGEPDDHVYSKAKTLDAYVRGLYSTGNIKPKEDL
jgi:hypothetical protein